MRKYAHAQIMTKALVPDDASPRELRRFAHRHHFDYEVRPGFLYVRSRAISSRCNDNFDEFPAEELEKAYATFKGKPVFVNHHNDDHKRARGVIIDAALHKDSNRDGTKDYWVEVLMEVDALRFPKLAAEIMNGNIARTSMGCDVAFSVCSACGNKATTPAEYCQHIPASKGMTLYRTTASGHKVGEIIRETCYGLKFFENSLLVEPPADPTAFFLGVDTRGVKTASKTAASAPGLSWDEIGERHPHVYGDPEIHGEAAEHADGQGIGWAAQHLAFDRPGNEDGENDGSSVHDLTFHHVRVPVDSIDYQHHGWGDGRVENARRGYESSNPERVPPLVLVHRHGVFQVADGHHRAQGAREAGLDTVPAYVAKSPHPRTPFFDGEKAPYHGAEPVKWSPPRARKTPAAEAPSQTPGWTQDRLFEAMKKGAPFAGYDDFEDCTAQNSDKDDPDAYCGEIKHKVEDGKKESRLTLAELMAEGTKDPRFAEVGLKQDEDGHYVTTHRARSDSYPSPEAIPQDVVDRIAATGAATPPEDHPWFKETGLSHHHVLDHWDAATDEEKKQGARWYPDAHLVAKSIAKLDPRIKTDAEAAHKGAGVLSAYSPQQGWWANQHNAARSFHEQRALGKGEGIMIMSSHANAAQKIMDGMDHQEALRGPKTQDFAHLIEHGGYKPQSPQDAKAGKPREHSDKVVVDRHALSVAAGRRLNADDVKGFPSQSRKHYEVVANHYRKAAAVISDREGREVPPHEVQAVTWLARQRLNAHEDNSPGQKGRNTVQRNQRKQWQDLSREHTPELHETNPPNSHVAGANGDLPEGIQFGFHRNYKGSGNHAIEATVPHPATGEPQHAGYLEWFPNHGMISMIQTHPDYRRRGIGDAMLGRAHEMARVHGLTPPTKSDVVFPDGEAWNGHTRVTPGQDYSANPTQVVGPPQPKHQDIREHLAKEHGMNIKGLDWPDESFHQTHEVWHQHGIGVGGATFHVHGSRKVAFGEQKAPADVDTLREDACPVCGDRDTFDGATCQVCGYVAPPKMFQDPDLEKARQMDLRKDIGEFNDPSNPMAGQVGPDGQPLAQDQAGGPMDPTALDENGNPINPDAADPNAQPGSLPGEVQAEVQPGGDPMDPAALGPDGQPLDPAGIPNELGAPVDPAMLGPDGQPLQQPGQQMMVGPNGEPIGPQALPADAMTSDGKPFTPGPNMPMGPGEPESPEDPEAPLRPDEVGSEGQIPTDAPGDGQIPNPDAGQGVPGTPGDGVPDLQCPACGFTADATNPVSVDMDTSIAPPSGQATPDGIQAGDVCPNCGAGQLMSPAEMQGQVPVPVPM